jgi:hypothetical protein
LFKHWLPELISEVVEQTLEQCADALDALICAFAALAVINNDTLRYAEKAVDQEGLIAIERV